MAKQQQNDCACFEKAIALAEAREQTTLITVLLGQLQTLLTDYHIRFLDVIPGDPLKLKEIGTSTGTIVANELEQAACQTQENQQTATVKGLRAVYPVHGVGRIKHLIEVRGQQLDAQKGQTLEQLITLFNCQFMLLEKNTHDALTSLYNRHAFNDRLQQVTEMHQKRNSGKQTQHCLAFVDIDHFKKINDSFGHLYGDEVLILIAGLMEQTFRHEDMLFRYGGEEFVILLNNIEPDAAAQVLERFCRKIAAYEFPKVGNVTVSIGITAISPGTLPIIMLERADKALYYSKSHNRNQVNVFECLLAKGELTDEEPTVMDVEMFSQYRDGQGKRIPSQLLT